MRRAAAFLGGLFEVARDHWYPMLVVVDEAQLAPAVAGEVPDEARKLSLSAGRRQTSSASSWRRKPRRWRSVPKWWGSHSALEELAERCERVAPYSRRAVMAEPDAGFRAVGVLYQEFVVRLPTRASVRPCLTWVTSVAC